MHSPAEARHESLLHVPFERGGVFVAEPQTCGTWKLEPVYPTCGACWAPLPDAPSTCPECGSHLDDEGAVTEEWRDVGGEA